MSIYRPGDFNHIDRVQSISGDHSEDDEQNKKKRKKVVYQGRSYEEKEDDLPKNSSSFELNSKPLPESKARKLKDNSPLYADKLILEQARMRLAKFTTLEEKIASFCFLVAEATYDPILQSELESSIQIEQIGGILFKKGDFKRQSYLIDHLQNLAKTPLLFGNAFLHGLSFYFEGNLPLDTLQNKVDEKRFADLGKAVVAQNRRLGVHFQFDRPLNSKGTTITILEENIQAFRKGIRDAKGIVGKERTEHRKPPYSQSSKKIASFTPPAFLKNPLEPAFTSLLNDQAISETVGMRNLEFIDLTFEMHFQDEGILAAFMHHFDAILLANNISQTIAAICRLVRSGQIQEEEINKRALRILLVKMLLLSP